MTKYNKKSSTAVQTVTNHQGGEGYQLKPELELVAILMTGMDNTYYEKEDDRTKRFAELIKTVAAKDLKLVAQMLVYARSVSGQRTVTHLGAVEFAKHISGNAIGKSFYSKRSRKENKGGIVYRLDDMLEIMACYMFKNPGKALPNAMKKGFKSALENADAYELAKYQAKGKQVSLVDAVNLIHPNPRAEMKEVFAQLMKGELKQFNTVEDKNTKAGQEVAAKIKSGEITKEEGEKELVEAKGENFGELIRTKKIGYLALLRNLRNIILNDNGTGVVKEACDLLVNKEFIKKSLVFPHQIDIALEVMLQEFKPSQMKEVAEALNTAYELSIPNLSALFEFGRTAVVFDTSASMGGGYIGGVMMGGKKINSTPKEKAALIGATLAKGIGADLYQFASYCKEVRYNPNDSFNTVKNIGLQREGEVGHGTEFNSIFSELEKSGKYDRIFIISDMQGGDSIVRNSSYQSYCKKHGKPYIYTINIVGYGTTMFKQDSQLIQLFGYSADIYEKVKTCELNPNVVLDEIRKIVI